MATEKGDGVADKIREIILAEGGEGAVLREFPSKPRWADLKRCGSALWLDTGDVEESSALWCREFSALTTNNTLLNKEVQKGIYDNLIAKAAKELKGTVAEERLPLEIAFVLNSIHGLRLSRLFGAKVSVELHTELADDIVRSVAYGRRYYTIAPESFYIKVPLTPAGILAARQLGDEGIPVNFTLGFSARQNYLVTALAKPAFVNIFLGRLNAFVADQNLGNGKFIGEKATLASQRAIRSLRRELGIGTKQIAASMRDGVQVESLAGVDVLTMPPKVAREYEQLVQTAGKPSSQVENDPEISLTPGIDREALGFDILWEVPADFAKAVLQLRERDFSRFSTEDIREFLGERGFANLLPAWSLADINQVTSDGKIPSYSHWKDRLASAKVDIDSLMTISGLRSFAVDQKAMDDRIRAML